MKRSFVPLMCVFADFPDVQTQTPDADLAFSCQTPRLVSPILYNPIKETMDSITSKLAAVGDCVCRLVEILRILYLKHTASVRRVKFVLCEKIILSRKALRIDPFVSFLIMLLRNRNKKIGKGQEAKKKRKMMGVFTVKT